MHTYQHAPKPCIICGTDVGDSWMDKKYCSKECKTRAAREWRKNYMRRHRAEKICLTAKVVIKNCVGRNLIQKARVR